MNDFIIKNLTLDSREVAKMLAKNHSDLLKAIARNIEYLIKSKIAFNEFFQENQYKDKIGRSLKRYDITKKGCEFLAHKMTGEKGATFTATYINKFYEMEKIINSQKALPFQSETIMIPISKANYWQRIKELSEYADNERDKIYKKLNQVTKLITTMTREVDKLSNIVFETENCIRKLER